MCLPLGVQVSEVSKASLGQSSIVSSSGPLNSVGLVFEREGRCSTFHLQSSRALCPFFIFKLELPTALIILPPVSAIFFFFMLLNTALSPSHVRGLYRRKKGMVSRCECVFFALVLQRNLYMCVYVCAGLSV